MKFVKYLLILAVCCVLLGAGSVFGLYKYIEPQLPDVATLKDVRLQIPMQVYSAMASLLRSMARNAVFPSRCSKCRPS